MGTNRTAAAWRVLHHRRRCPSTMCLLVAGLVWQTAALQADPPDTAGLRFALLVGVGNYAHLNQPLDGCENDVAAMKEMLRSRFGFTDSEIVTLVDDQATADAIRRELQHIQDRVTATAGVGPATIVFHFSGHGSQVPDQPEGDLDCDEADGLDETLVPFDAVQQGGQQDIRDDEIYRFVDAVCRDGRAKLWMVLDCCHSGTGARGATKIRQLQRDIRPSPNQAKRVYQRKRLPPGAVFLSACRAQEVEPEYFDGEKSYGLLTRFLVEVLNEKSNVSNLSYELLREVIVARYRSNSAVSQPPTPTLEYGDPQVLTQSIMGGSGLDRQPLWAVESIHSDPLRVRMHAGRLHGVTVGSLFELYAAADEVVWDTPQLDGKHGESLGWVEVETVTGGSAVCRVFRWEQQQRQPVRLPADFPAGVAVERLHEFGPDRLRVRVVRALSPTRDSHPLTPDDAETPDVIRHTLQSAVQSDESRWLQWVRGDAACDLLLRIDQDFAALFPATGRAQSSAPTDTESPRTIPRSLVGGWGPFDLRKGDEEVQRAIHDALRRIIRARNLIAIASRPNDQARRGSGGGRQPVQVGLQLLAVDQTDDQFNITQSHEWAADDSDGQHSGRLTMRNGDQYGYRIVNEEPSGKPIYVTVLHIDSQMGIDQIHPWQPAAGAVAEGEQRLEAGESLMVPGYFICNGEPDETPIYGSRWAIVLATRTPNQFHLLAQGGLPVTRNTTSSLENLLLERTELKTRGGFGRRRRPVNPYDDSWGAAAVEWIVVRP